ncbi:MAG: hypothetical protein ACK5LC_15860 [Coprobacillaceae bacterium]
MKKVILSIACVFAVLISPLGLTTADAAETSTISSASSRYYYEDDCCQSSLVPGYGTYTVNQFFYGSYPTSIVVGNVNVLRLTSVRQLTPYYFYCTYSGYAYQY